MHHTPGAFAERTSIASHIVSRLQAERDAMAAQWRQPLAVKSCVIDNLVPEALLAAIHTVFPAPEGMMLKRSFRENKRVAAQMDCYDPLLEEIIYAFQDDAVVNLVADITGLVDLEPDTELYAGGISAMGKGAYLRPHLDNSHDRNQDRYRVLNLLFYVTPGWTEADGGALQLWDDGPGGAPRTIASLPNRLVIMQTDRRSWHSVNEVLKDGVRCCVSNYYFSQTSPEDRAYFHATSFRPEHASGLRDMAMRADNALRTAILSLTGAALFKNPHVYKRKD